MCRAVIEIIGEDPGGTTGIARFTLDPVTHEVKDWEAFEVTADGASNWLGWWLPEYVKTRDKVFVGCERFIITAGTIRKSRTDRYDAIEMIGHTRHLCRWYDAHFELQSAGDAKSAVSNENLKRAGWWTPKTDGHAIDATRHAVLCMMNRGVPPPWV